MNTIYQNNTDEFIFRIHMLQTGEIQFNIKNTAGSDTFLSMDSEEAELFFHRLENLWETEDFLSEIGILSRRVLIQSDGEDLMIYRQKPLWDSDACAYLFKEEVQDLINIYHNFLRFQEAGEC